MANKTDASALSIHGTNPQVGAPPLHPPRNACKNLVLRRAIRRAATERAQALGGERRAPDSHCRRTSSPGHEDSIPDHSASPAPESDTQTDAGSPGKLPAPRLHAPPGSRRKRSLGH